MTEISGKLVTWIIAILVILIILGFMASQIVGHGGGVDTFFKAITGAGNTQP